MPLGRCREVPESVDGYIHHRGPITSRIVRHDAVQAEVYLSFASICSKVQYLGVEAKATSMHYTHRFCRWAVEKGVLIYRICMLEEETGYMLEKKVR